MAKLIDYYAILRVPATADLAGVENAYAQVSHELATRMGVDDTSTEALRIVNEAYAILSHPEYRRDYDRQYFAAEIVRQDRLSKLAERRQRISAWILYGALLLIIAAQSIALAFLAKDAI